MHSPRCSCYLQLSTTAHNQPQNDNLSAEPQPQTTAALLDGACTPRNHLKMHFQLLFLINKKILRRNNTKCLQEAETP